MNGLLSAAIEEEITSELRRRGIVVWLDRDQHYTTLVDRLIERRAAGDFPFPVVGFRGSFLDLLVRLEPYGSGLDNAPLLIHMPGFTEESIRETPVLELYEPGFRFRKGLDTLAREAARGRVAPDALDQFLASAPRSLDEVDAWLSRKLGGSGAGLDSLLQEADLPLVIDAFVGKQKRLHGRDLGDADAPVVQAYLHRHVGLDARWLTFFGGDPGAGAIDRLAAATIGWLLSVEYVHDLARPPHLDALKPLRTLSAPLVAASQELVRHLRAKHPDTYATLAEDIEQHLLGEISTIRPEDLGKIDTFRTEELRILDAAIEALKAGEWSKAREWARARSGETAFWLQRDQARRWTWTLVGEAAELGELLAQNQRPLEGVRGVDDAVERYAHGACEVDRAHRRFEQKRIALLEPRIPNFGDLQEIVGSLRRLCRAWADRLTRDFTAVCQEHGFLPDAGLQQRTLYEQVVQPLTAGTEKVAVFVVDALRYEMAAELAEELRAAGAVVDLRARLAELPTITSVGMNALAPVAQPNGHLSVAGTFQGFRTGEFTVRTPNDRARAMGTRSVGQAALLLNLADVCDAEATSLKRRLSQARLILVHSKEIDDAGEANMGLPTFDLTLRQLRSAWHHLQAAGVARFVFTADHGFLLQDETTKTIPYGKKTDPSRRHILADEARAEAGMVPVSLQSLGYDGIDGYLLLREDTALFATGTAGASFVHGGNSLQERVIPVLTATRSGGLGVGYADYGIQVERLADMMGVRRIRTRVVVATTSLGFVGSKAVQLAVRVPERTDIMASLRDASGTGSIRSGRLFVPLGESWTELCFSLHGPQDERVRIEVFHPDAVERIAPCLVDGLFDVEGRASVPPPAPRAGWTDLLPDEGTRSVFLHLEQHRSITEIEITRLLGSPRAFRRFSLEFEGHAEKVPFKVRIEPGPDGKRYVKEGEK